MPNGQRILMDRPTFAFWITLAFLISTWGVLYAAVGIATWSLTPYDTTPLTLRPPLGSWERSLNDFFESPVGGNLPEVVTVAASLVLLVFALRHASANSFQRAKLVLVFAVSNLIVSAAIFGTLFVVGDLPLHLTPYPGYGWTIKFLVPQGLLLVLLLVFQGKVIPTRLTWISR